MSSLRAAISHDPLHYCTTIVLTRGPGTGAVIIDGLPPDGLMRGTKLDLTVPKDFELVYDYCVGKPWDRHVPRMSFEVAQQTINYLKETN